MRLNEDQIEKFSASILLKDVKLYIDSNYNKYEEFLRNKKLMGEKEFESEKYKRRSIKKTTIC